MPAGIAAGDQAYLSLNKATIPVEADAAPVWVRDEVGARYRTRLALFRHAQGWLLNIDCEGKGRLLIRDDAIDIDWHGGTPADHYLQTIGLALWLELRGALCLHANTLSRDGAAIGLIAPSQTGKTTLSAVFMQRGWRLLNDDMAAMHGKGGSWQVHPSRPQLRLWPDSAQYFHGDDFRDLAPVHARFAKRIAPLPGIASADAVPLRHLFVLDRREGDAGEITFERLSPSDALLLLVQNSILGDAVQALGIEAKRLKALAGLLATVSVTRVSYPSGFAQLDELRRAIENRL